ncbi:MAG TPA: serine hydrolase domain-containing protein [Verrucomicrobiae bacterium]|nr:serine hydrolase domain-containing protein [Verrucomicrobiae bacterium]
MAAHLPILFSLLSVGALGAESAESNRSRAIVAKVEEIRKNNEIPAVAFGVIKDGKIVLQGALGIRRLGTDDPVETQDRFHIGSNTKSVTAFIAGRLVDQKKLSWGTRFFDLFPDLRTNSHAGFHNMTLSELLRHRCGLTSFKGGNQWRTIEEARARFHPANQTELKVAVARHALMQAPAVLTKEKPSLYSNLGYLLAAMMLERVSGKTYEELIEQLNEDLKLDFRIGWPRLHGADQPAGHIIPVQQGFGDRTTLGPMPEDIEAWQPWRDWVSLCRPAGDLCVSVADFLRFLNLTMRGLYDEAVPLKPATSREILRGQMGWGSYVENGIHFYDAAGSLCTFNSIAIIFEEPKVGIVVMINTGNYRSLKAMYEIKRLLEDEFARP